MGSWFSTPNKDPYGTLNPEQVTANKALGPDLTQRATGDASQFQYGGQLTAPIGQGEQDVVNNNARLNAVAGNTFANIGNYDPNQINANFDKYVQAPTLQNWQNNEAPYLRENLNAFSSEQGNVLARALVSQQNNLAQQRMGYLQQGKTDALNALSGANTYNQGSAAIQAIPREIQQAGLTNQYNNFIQANQQKTNSINQALQFLGISTGSVTQEPTTFGNLLAAGQAVGNIYSSFTGGGGSKPATGGDLGSQVQGFGGGTANPGSPGGWGGVPSTGNLSAPASQWQLASMAGV